ncbi:MAG: C40 family peptidase [Saprospiraceae bacterium]
MKKLPGLLILAGLLATQCQRPTLRDDIAKALETTREQFCPDKRTCIWEVEALRGAPFILKGKTNLPEAKQALVQWLSEKGFPFQDSLQILSPGFALVNVSVCNIRTEPRHSAELATQATLGTPLKVYEQQGDWYRVQTPDQYLGWMDAGGLFPLDSQAFARWQRSDRIIVTGETSASWQNPDPGSLTNADLVSGCILEKTGESGGFFKVAFPDGGAGYVLKKHAQALSDWKEAFPSGPEPLIETAFTLMGRPYLWGGTSAKGMDCSGFTKTVFFRHGLVLPRDASQQVRVGAAVETDSSFTGLLPGDLLFFGRQAEEDTPEKITHVAIYLGEGQFIHASGKVKVESLFPEAPNYAENRRSSFVRARRIAFPDSSLVGLDWYFSKSAF